MLLAMLVLLSGVGAIVSSMSVADGDFRKSIQNRIAATRDIWLADGCASIAIAAIESELQEASSPVAINTVWANLDVEHRGPAWSLLSPCHVALEPSGTRLGVNQVSEESLRASLSSIGSSARRDSMVDSYLDWRDADDSTRASGAERGWYVKARRALPRNDNFEALAEVRLVRGWDAADVPMEYLQLENERVVLDRAPRVVLQMMHGLSSEAIEWIDHNRKVLRGQDISVMFDHLSPEARTALQREYAGLRATTSVVPESWYMECAGATASRAAFRIRLRLIRAGDRISVDRRWEIEP